MARRLEGGRSVAAIRQHSVFKYAASSLVPRGLAIATSLVLMPLGIKTLGVHDYGLWVLATQVPSLVISPDLGLGQAVVNDLSRRHRTNGSLTSETPRLLGLTKLLAILACAWLVIGVCVASIYSFVASGSTGTQSLRLFAALSVGLGSFLIGLPATIWTRAQLAQERGHVAVLWEGVGKALALLLSLLVLAAQPSLIALVVAFLLPNSITLWLNAVRYSRPTLAPDWRARVPSAGEAYRQNTGAIRVGAYFLVAQLAFVISTAIDPYLVNAFLSSADVSTWSVTKRPFDLLPLAVSLYSTALWPVFAKWDAQNRRKEVRRLAGASVAIGCVLICCGGAVIFVLRQPIYHLLGQGEVSIYSPDLAWFTLAAVASTTALVLSNYLNAVDFIKQQALIGVLSAVFTSIVKMAALSVWGLHAFIAAAALGTTVLGVVPLGFIAWRRMQGAGAPTVMNSTTRVHTEPHQ